ncbi:hypothetical protein ACQ4PT_037971 [Festuca glaucescens]
MNDDETKEAADDRQGEPLLGNAVSTTPTGDAGYSWPTVVGFAFLTFTSGMVVYLSKGVPAAVSFAVFSYLNLVLLFYCLRRLENAEPDSPARGKLKIAVCVLATLLTAVVTYKVAAVMPLPVQILVWGMAATTVGGGFYSFFLCQEGKDC